MSNRNCQKYAFGLNEVFLGGSFLQPGPGLGGGVYPSVPTPGLIGIGQHTKGQCRDKARPDQGLCAFWCKEARVTAQSTAQFDDSLKIIVATRRRHSGWRQSALKIFPQYLLWLDDAESFYLSKVAVVERCHVAAALQSCCSDD